MTADVAALPAATKLALERTRLAYERTLMAWVRTATSLISFGFSIYKFFQYLNDGKPTVGGPFFGPREFALLMIGIGLTALIFATVEQRQNLGVLRAEYGSLPRSTAAVVASLVAILGVFGLLTVLLQQ